MASMLIRNISDDVMKRFKERAKAEGKSAEELAREALSEKAKPSREEILRRMETVRAQSTPIDLETTLRIMDEARAERDSMPHLSDPSGDR